MLWYVVPLGVAAALSVFPILAVVLLLLSPNPIPASVGYLAGWSGGVLVLVTLFSLGARLIPPSTTERMPSWAHVVEIAIGVLLVVGGIWRTAADRRRPEPASAPSWTKALDKVGPRRAFAFGLAMNVRPKNLAIALAAGLAIGSASLSIVGSSLTVLIFTAVFLMMASHDGYFLDISFEVASAFGTTGLRGRPPSPRGPRQPHPTAGTLQAPGNPRGGGA